jgi:hypothetical protein
MKTFLTEQNIDSLKGMFANRETYEQHLRTLGGLRALLWKNLENDLNRENPNYDHPQYPIFQLCNDLIGALLQNGYSYTGGVLDCPEQVERQREVIPLVERNEQINIGLITGEVSRTMQENDWMNDGSKLSIVQGDTLESTEATSDDLLEMTLKPLLCIAKMRADGKTFCGRVSAKMAQSGVALRMDFLKPDQQPIYTSIDDIVELRKVVNIVRAS